ncbi:enoyl-CoA hydratase/isomerase family protein, partial [Aequoribacter sp.]
DLRGVVFASAKKVFFAGGDLNDLVKVQPEEVEQFFQGLQATKAVLRRIEKLPVPVAAAINGAALGGGFEIALCCNYRVAWND